MNLQVWSDAETQEDLLGFRVHADLIRSLVTDASMLPVTIGVFGDWGGGKSSIMRMLEHDFEQEEEYKDVACLYFNSWQFEGYEDAKSALLSSILIQLAEHKTVGNEIKDRTVKLLKRVKWMEVAKAGIKHVGIPLVTATLTGGLSVLPGVAATLVSSSIKRATSENETGESSGKKASSWSDLIEADPDKPDVLEISKFRDDFADMLKMTKLRALVVLVDDLDRCLPERLIETLEAIKLFVSVPKTAFVIGADPRIVRHAIATRYVQQQIRDNFAATNTERRAEEYDLVQDYLEKLIQIPYYLPRLSPAEIETYLNLLACQKSLGSTDWLLVKTAWIESKKTNFHQAFRQKAIRSALGSGTTISSALSEQLAWSGSVAPAITEGLKGNPRQVKRMLNAMSLRKQLAQTAALSIKDEVLAKLMVLEYSQLDRFKDLNNWQASQEGHPKEIRDLEQFAINDGTAPAFDGADKWTEPGMKTWLRMDPPLRDHDLRDYFWLARDRTNSILASVSMLSPIVRRLLQTLTSGNKGQILIAAKSAKELETQDRQALLASLQAQASRRPEDAAPIAALDTLSQSGVVDASVAFLAAVRSVDASQLVPSLAVRLTGLSKSEPALKSEVDALLLSLAKQTGTKIGRAASAEIQPKGKRANGNV